MRHFTRLVIIVFTVLRYGMDELALSGFRQRWETRRYRRRTIHRVAGKHHQMQRLGALVPGRFVQRRDDRACPGQRP